MPVLFAIIALAGSPLTSWPTTTDAQRWHPAPAWMRSAKCIHNREAPGQWHIDHIDWQGRASPYAGGMQFLDSTWRRAGGTGNPARWSKREQQYRAWRIWKLGGGSWREWGTARACGLR